MDSRILRLIATVIEVCDPPRKGGRGHPPADTVRVLRTLDDQHPTSREFDRPGTMGFSTPRPRRARAEDDVPF